MFSIFFPSSSSLPERSIAGLGKTCFFEFVYGRERDRVIRERSPGPLFCYLFCPGGGMKGVRGVWCGWYRGFRERREHPRAIGRSLARSVDAVAIRDLFGLPVLLIVWKWTSSPPASYDPPSHRHAHLSRKVIASGIMIFTGFHLYCTVLVQGPGSTNSLGDGGTCTSIWEK